jgi:hypothetical protein
MSMPRDYLFLLAANGRARLVRHSLVDSGYVTTWRSSTTSDDLARQIIIEADAQIIDCRLEGLFIVAPDRDMAPLCDRLERSVEIVGTIEADMIDIPDALLGHALDPVREGQVQER